MVGVAVVVILSSTSGICLWGRVTIAHFPDIESDLGMCKTIGKMHFPLTSLGAACASLQADGMRYVKLSLVLGGLF